MSEPHVFRAPMRSRDSGIDEGATVERALRLGVCGMGERASSGPEAARLEARRARFAAAPDGSYVWTRDADGMLWVGRLDGPVRRDDDPDARRVDLVHVRPCAWRDEPVSAHDAPAAVRATFARGGRNWQRIHDPEVGARTAALFDG
ncbi:GAF domain-containing protein [Microbacterium sp. GXF7504]